LIRKINQQLLSRLHQERNPIVRPYIKNFPLQIERLKSYISAFIHELNTTDNKIDIQGIYLTSALQPGLTTDTAADITNPDPEARALQIMERPTAKSRSYFIKQFITNGLQTSVLPRAASSQKKLRKKFILYAISATAISFAAIVLGRDFLTGLNQTHQIHANLADYQHVLQEFHNPDKSMLKTLTLLDTLHRTKVEDEKKTFINRILNYYSDKSQKNASKVYYSALQAFLLPEIRNYFADYLQNPINKDAESIYAVLKAYLMMGDMTHFDSNYIRSVLLGIMPKSFDKTSNLITYYDAAIKNYKPVVLDSDIIIGTRKYLLSLRGNQLGNIILRSLDNNTQRSDALLGDNDKTNALFINKKNGPLIASMYTGKNFVNVFEQEIQIAANEAAGGNWVLGTDFRINPNPNYPSELAEEMRNEYVKSYADAWETLLTNTQIETPRDLEQADAIITSMISYDSPLLRILNNIHENTFFEPVTTASPKLFSIGELIDRNNPSKTELYQILTQLEALHQYLQPVLTASDPRKAAYQLITKRMKHQGEMDPITKLRVAADQSPMPIKGWINQLTNDTWHHLLKNSMHYLDTSWAEKVSNRFETHIAHRYPFSSDASDEVTYEKFIHFFGKPGIITSYFNNYLLPFVDTSTTEWKWKSLNGQPLPLSSDSLHQIQQAINIHQAFFPKDDDNLYVPFVLQQKLLAKNIESITLNINSKIIVDKRKNGKYPHTLNWPYNLDAKFTSVALNVAGQKATQLDYPGSWGWFRLVNQSFESAKSSSQIILNFSKDDYPAKYMLSTNSKLNPFLDLNLGNFNLPKQLTTLEA
jgi:type VI protein secretion system component VasK